MNLRPGVGGPSTTYVRAKVTEAERDAHAALAEYCRMQLSDLIRQLLDAERARREAAGERIPKRPKRR